MRSGERLEKLVVAYLVNNFVDFFFYPFIYNQFHTTPPARPWILLCKFVPLMKAYDEVKAWLHLFFISTLVESTCWNSRVFHLIAKKSAPSKYWTGGWAGTRDCIRVASTRNRIATSRFAQPYPSHYTDWAIPPESLIIICYFYFQLRTAAFKAYCAIWFRRSNFRHQASPRVSPSESTQRRKVELWARNIRKFCLNAELHVTFRDLLHAVKLRHGTDGFNSPPKEDMLRIFSP